MSSFRIWHSFRINELFSKTIRHNKKSITNIRYTISKNNIRKPNDFPNPQTEIYNRKIIIRY